jgi:hypothetical protein
MSRDENEDVSGLTLPDPIITKCIYHMENGEVISGEVLDLLLTDHKLQHRKPPVICAKSILNTSTNINTYFILCANSIMFDPRNKDSRYRSRNRWKIRRVKKSVYDLYVKFLKTNHNTFLYQAEREI